MLKIENLAKSFGGVAATNDVSLHFPKGSLTAVIGPNGAGKTTLLRLLQGQQAPDQGSVAVGPTVKFAAIDQGRATAALRLRTRE